jgi:alpha-tubulin suppressor-like RCC1 family protein
VSVGDVRVVEGDTSHPTAWFTVSLSAATTVPVTVTYATAAGTATADSDFITAAGTAVVPAGSLGAQVSVVINGDTVIEPNENFTIALSAPVRATLGRATGMGTILTDDPATGLRVDVGDASIVEGQTGFLALRLTVSLSTLSLEPVSVDWSTTSVTAAAGIDYAATAGTLTIPAGESSGWIDVAVRADRFPESNKTFNVMLANATGGAAELGRATGVGTILDDDDGAAAGRISGGAGHTCMVRAGGTVRCWGSNSFHELGDGTTSYRTSPVTVAGLTGIVSVSAGGYLTCVLRGNGTVGCWGRNDVGELGDGTFVERSAPLSVSGLTHAVAVSAGGSSACAVRRDGTVSCWGENFYGELGDGTFTNRSTPVPVAGLRGVVTVSSGGGHVCALLNDGTVECWGWNAYGQLGDDTHVNRSRPVAVSGLTGAVSISTGTQHSCALLGDGKVRCWGSNLWGQLGDGTSVDRSTPVTVAGVTSGVSVHTGWAHTCAVLRDTTMRCWGYDQSGELGDGRMVLTGGPAPVTVSGLSGVVAASAGGYHTCVIRRDTSVECWGWNAFGQLGDGTGRDRATPVRVVGW